MQKYKLSDKVMHHKGIIYTLIDCHDIISFDIFDTLIKRNVSKPEDIFSIVQKRYHEKTGKDVTDFRILREKAEKEARAKSASEEIILEEVYDILEKEYGVDKSIINIEISVEQEYCIANFPVKKIYEYCKKRGKKIIIVSDMYISSANLKKILEKCGYDDYEKLYVSSEYLRTKRTGELFKQVVFDFHIKANKILHIGDNWKSDVLAPLKKRIHTWHIKRDKIYTRFLEKKDLYNERSCILPCLNNNICRYDEKNNAFKYGYELLGPLLAGFCLWIERESIKNGYDELYFLARDMYLVFDSYKKLTNHSNIQYLEVSRKSLRSSYVLKKGSILSVLDTMSRNDYIIEDLINALNISRESQKEIISFCGDKIVSKHVYELKGEDLSKVNECMVKVLKKENILTLEFLQERGLFVGNNCLIDVGWHGTIQNIIENLCEIRCNGLYFGSTRRKNYVNMSTTGYWFNSDNESDVKEKLDITYILEVMLLPPVGTTVGYEKSSSGITPVFENNKYEVPSLIRDFQKGALKFVEDYAQQISDKEEIASNIAVKAYSRFAFHPTYTDAKMFCKQIIEDGELYYLCKIHTAKEYIKNPKLLLQDYKKSKWKEGYIKLILPFVGSPHRIACMVKRRRKY